VIVKSIAPIPVFVGGEVAQPGEIATVGTAPTLSQAIARAGGIRMTGDESRVFIVRRGPNDQPVFLSTRYDTVRLAENPQADVRLSPFDVVMVPRLGVAEIYRWYNQYVQQFVSPTIGFSYLINPTNNGQTVVNASH
jgi:polysaccharide export outer membrane protein